MKLTLLMVLLFASCTFKEKPSKGPLESVVTVEAGQLDGMEIRVFKDVATGRHILYYRDMMVLLPEVQAEK